MFSSLTFQSELHVGVVAHNVRHESHDVFLDDLQIAFLLVGIGGDLNGSISIDPLDTEKTTPSSISATEAQSTS